MIDRCSHSLVFCILDERYQRIEKVINQGCTRIHTNKTGVYLAGAASWTWFREGQSRGARLCAFRLCPSLNARGFAVRLAKRARPGRLERVEMGNRSIPVDPRPNGFFNASDVNEYKNRKTMPLFAFAFIPSIPSIPVKFFSFL